MRLKENWTFYVAAVFLLAFAVAYFALTYSRSLNASDEGYLIYNFLKTANGQLPHRDFYDDYGPLSYWLAAALFRLFGTEIIVIRIFLLVLKSVMALLIFLIARKIMPPLFALVAGALFVLNWGDPLFPEINVLYAGHLSHFLALLGMVSILRYGSTGQKLWLLGCGLFVGLGMLCKFQPAVIDFFGFALYLCLREQAGTPQTSEPATGNSCPRIQTLQFMRILKLAGIVAVGSVYLVHVAGSELDLSRFFLFLLPIFLFLFALAMFEFGVCRSMHEEERIEHWTRLGSLYSELITLLIPPFLMIVSVIILYSAMNGLHELFYDTFILPTRLKFHYSMPDRRALAAFVAAIVLMVLIFIKIGGKLGGKGQGPRALFAALVLLLLVLGPTIGIMNGVSYRLWHKLVTHSLLPAILLIVSYLYYVEWRRNRSAGCYHEEFFSLGLILIFACQASLMTSIRSDETHAALNGTVVFVLVGYILWRLYESIRRFSPGRQTVAAVLAVLVCLAILSSPYLWSIKILYFPPDMISPEGEKRGVPSHPILKPDAPRARGLALPIGAAFAPPLNNPMFVNINKTVNFIYENTRPDDRIFLVCGDQIIYFLAERESILQKENYFVYLSNVELIDRDYTGKITDEQMLERLISLPPRFIIQTPKYSDTVHFGLTWPKTISFINNAYTTQVIFGEYEILRPRHLPSNLP